MVTHSNVLAWRIPGTGEPGGLRLWDRTRVGHNGRDLVAAATPEMWVGVWVTCKWLTVHISTLGMVT